MENSESFVQITEVCTVEDTVDNNVLDIGNIDKNYVLWKLGKLDTDKWSTIRQSIRIDIPNYMCPGSEDVARKYLNRVGYSVERYPDWFAVTQEVSERLMKILYEKVIDFRLTNDEIVRAYTKNLKLELENKTLELAITKKNLEDIISDTVVEYITKNEKFKHI